jgi:alcohol dehydrogenase class IV
MDVAKLAAYLIKSGDSLDDLWGVGRAKGDRLPLVLVPTTAGTGSEATPVTIITVGESEKRGLSSEALVADWAILDAELTLGLPREVTAATGIVLNPALEESGTQAQARAFVQRLTDLSIQAGLPQRLRDVGVTHADLDLLASEAMKQERLLINNPCPITQADARRLYEAAL